MRTERKDSPINLAKVAIKATAEKKKTISDSFDEWCAYLVLQGADKN